MGAQGSMQIAEGILRVLSCYKEIQLLFGGPYWVLANLAINIMFDKFCNKINMFRRLRVNTFLWPGMFSPESYSDNHLLLRHCGVHPVLSCSKDKTTTLYLGNYRYRPATSRKTKPFPVSPLSS